jgi:hypothetical protein
VHPNISILFHQNVVDALEKKYLRLCNPSSFLHLQTLPTTSETTQKVQIQERKPLFILHASCTSLSLAKNRKPIFAPIFEHPNRRAKPTNSKSSKELEENTFISWFWREPPRKKKSNSPQLNAGSKTKP